MLPIPFVNAGFIQIFGQIVWKRMGDKKGDHPTISGLKTTLRGRSARSFLMEMSAWQCHQQPGDVIHDEIAFATWVNLKCGGIHSDFRTFFSGYVPNQRQCYVLQKIPDCASKCSLHVPARISSHARSIPFSNIFHFPGTLVREVHVQLVAFGRLQYFPLKLMSGPVHCCLTGV